jgi:N-methylhydantoinase B
MSIDPITAEVVQSRLRETTQAMAHALFHSGYSPILRESQDGTAGLTDAEGRVIMTGGGLQYHSLLYTQAVGAMRERYPAARMRDGDAFVSNDPYKAGNSHVPDTVVVSPVFYEGAIIAFGVSVAHKADVGGLVPGSSGAAAREIFHDGLLLPPVRVWSDGAFNPEVEAIIRNNSRAPDVVIGDLRGQIGATRLGAQRLMALSDQYGVDTVREAMGDLLRRTTERVRAAFADWPNGTRESEGWLDHDGADTAKPVRIHVRATKGGDRLSLDLSGSDPQTAGPVNTTGATARAVSMQAVLAASDPTIPMNSGAFEAVEFVIPPGRVVNPRFPATVNHYFPTSHLVYNCVLAALGQFNPDRAVAPSGLGTGAIAIGYSEGRAGKATVQYELKISSLGGTNEHDGAALVLPMNHFAPGTPIEVVETEYPVMVRRYDLWPDSAGAGRQRGGIGYMREYEFLTDCILTVRTSNHRHAAWGLSGGKGPPPSGTSIRRDGGVEEPLDVMETRGVKAGDRLALFQSGGGGYGDPLGRPAERVLRDVRDGYVSKAAAERDYGVVIDGDDSIDVSATDSRRSPE